MKYTLVVSTRGYNLSSRRVTFHLTDGNCMIERMGIRSVHLQWENTEYIPSNICRLVYSVGSDIMVIQHSTFQATGWPMGMIFSRLLRHNNWNNQPRLTFVMFRKILRRMLEYIKLETLHDNKTYINNQYSNVNDMIVMTINLNMNTAFALWAAKCYQIDLIRLPLPSNPRRLLHKKRGLIFTMPVK